MGIAAEVVVEGTWGPFFPMSSIIARTKRCMTYGCDARIKESKDYAPRPPSAEKERRFKVRVETIYEGRWAGDILPFCTLRMSIRLSHFCALSAPNDAS